MAHESFEAEDAAKVLNESFISVKVDREERPDIDEVYMSVCQAMTGSGGWPLTIIMAPDKKPFFAGTYLPKETAYGRMGLIQLLEKVAGLWIDNREELDKNSEEITKALSHRAERKEGSVDPESIIKKAYRHIQNSYDEVYGGFSQSPKFPTPHYILFLMNFWKAYDNYGALDMAEKTLMHMYRGGIFDHAGWGFSRYSTDRKWLVPHFEKMLYDNAMLLLAYTECFAATGNPLYRSVAEKTAAYMLRDMRSPEGGFYSAEDADSEGVEGKYYVWEYDELKHLLGDEELKFLEEGYGVTKHGNFEGANILNKIYAKENDTENGDAILNKLYRERLKRIPPFKDTKISASWNGLAIEAFARAGSVLGRQDFIDSASKTADFVLSHMRSDGGELIGIYGTHSHKGFLADYANVCNALIALYSATLDIRYLNEAEKLAKEMVGMFWDEQDKRFYMAAKGEEELFMRPSDEYDGAMPSGNSSAFMCLSKLYNMTGADWISVALDKAVEGFLSNAAAAPTACVHFLSALLMRAIPHRQVVISADKGNKEAMEAYKQLLSQFMPFTSIIYYDRSPEMDEAFPELAQYKTDIPFAGYVCENFACRKPVFSPEELLRELE